MYLYLGYPEDPPIRGTRLLVQALPDEPVGLRVEAALAAHQKT
jgi:hypothetical protein